MKAIKKSNVVLLMSLFLFLKANAHGDLSIRIIEKTFEISKNPKNSKLYFERGYLFQQHDEFKKAIKDYTKAERLGFNNYKLLHFRKTESYYKVNKQKKALKQVELCLKHDTTDIKTHKLKAKILFKLKQYKAGLTAYNYVIDNTLDLRPEDYMNYNDFILAIDNQDYKTAIKTLDLGMKNSGKNAITFQLKKIEYLKKSNQKEKVIALYNTLITNHKRKEFFYYEKANYLFENKDTLNANIALQQAKLAIKELKQKYQKTSAVKKLLTNINQLEIKL